MATLTLTSVLTNTKPSDFSKFNRLCCITSCRH